MVPSDFAKWEQLFTNHSRKIDRYLCKCVIHHEFTVRLSPQAYADFDKMQWFSYGNLSI